MSAGARTVVWDARWQRGTFGIARFGSEVSSRLTIPVHQLHSRRVSPTSPADPAFISVAARRRNAGLFVTPGFNAGLAPGCTQVLTIHDLIHLKTPDEASRLKSLYYATVVLPAIRQSRKVLTVSEFSRAEVMEWSGLAGHEVVCVGNGSSFQPTVDDPPEPRPRPFVLYVGNFKPHKNVRLLVAAVRHLPEELECVCVGVPEDQLRALAVEEGVDPGRFRVHNGIPDPALSGLYATASCCAMPSTYEGFGLPALEAMSHGTATAYCCDAVGEVVGTTGVRCDDPCDAEAYAAALLSAVEIGRERRGQLLSRSRQFDWLSVARRVQTVMSDEISGA